MTETYHFVSRWRLKANTDEVYDIISEPLEYPRWWPSVYLDSSEVATGAANGTGRRFLFHTKGLLPYTLRWESSVTEAAPPDRLAFEAAGDFEGRGIWSFVQDGPFVDITFDWKLVAGKRLFRYLTPVLRPVFEANHRWAMAQGEISLREELIRYRARTPEDLLEAAEPRGPVEVPVRWIAVGALAISAIACIALTRRRSRKAQSATA
jgi:Polyketide cyclase / dehydrase and lipid transport